QEGVGELGGQLPTRGGVALVSWSGGTVEALEDAASGITSLWVTSEGAFVGYHPDAPDFVNARFWALFPDGQVPSLPMLAVLPETSYAGNSEVIAFASVVPDWIDGLSARSESRLREPYDYF